MPVTSLSVSFHFVYASKTDDTTACSCELKVRFLESAHISFSNFFLKPLTEAYSEPYQISKMERFTKIGNG